MYPDQNSDDCLRNFPVAKPALDPNDLPFIGSLPETLSVFRRELGYDVRFLRAGSSEIDAVLAEKSETESKEDAPCLRVATFPVGDRSVKTYGFLVLKRDPNRLPQLDWDSACSLVAAFALTLTDNYRWRSEVDLCQGELAAAVVRKLPAASGSRNAFISKLREILRVGVRALGDYDAAALYLLDDATTCLSPRALWGLPDDRLLNPARPLRTARAEVEALLGNVVVVNDAYLAEAWNTPEDFECSVCVPVASETTILGVVWFFANKKRRVGVRELETFNLIVGRLVGELEQESSRLGLATVENTSNAEKEQEILETTSENEFTDVIDSILAGIKS